MTNTKTLLKALLGATALTVFATGTAQAQNNFTQAGTSVSNEFTLDYNVGGVPQPQIDNSATPTVFTVDRLVDLTVVSLADNTVAPGATDEDLVFSVSNEGNDTQAYSLTFVEETAAPDTIDTDAPTSGTPLVYYIDDGDGSFDPALDGPAVTYNPASPPELGPDDVLWVVVEQDIPTSATDGDQADISLVADTLEPASSPSAGTPVTADGDGNALTGAAENVLADAAGTSSTGDVANDGAHSATGAYIIASADLAGDKVVTVHSEDGSTCAAFPGNATGGYGIPGACVEYVISAENTGSAAATNIVINDELPAELEFAAAVFGGDFTGGSFASPALPAANTDCAAGACVINLTGATLPAPTGGAASTTGTVTIRAYVK